jgi:hypothetical protein
MRMMIDLSKTSKKQKRSKLKVALLSPLLVITFIIGWGLYYIGQIGHINANPERKKSPKKIPEIELLLIPPQEQTNEISLT